MNEQRNRTRTTQPHHAETNILSRIVDAILAVEGDLHDATVEQWTHAVADSCRRQKQWLEDLRLAASSTC